MMNDGSLLTIWLSKAAIEKGEMFANYFHIHLLWNVEMYNEFYAPIYLS